MGTWSQNTGLVQSASDWSTKHGIKDVSDFDKPEVQAKFRGVIGDQADPETLKKAYLQDQANQTAYDQDPTVRASRQAAAFAAKAPELKEQLGQGATSQARRQLASDLTQTRQAASGRGLLYGGMGRSAEQATRGMAGANLAQARSQINESVDSQVAQMRQGAAGTGLQAYGNAVQSAQNDYNAALKSYKNKNAMISQIGGGLGMAAGMAIAGPAGGVVGQQAGSALL